MKDHHQGLMTVTIAIIVSILALGTGAGAWYAFSRSETGPEAEQGSVMQVENGVEQAAATSEEEAAAVSGPPQSIEEAVAAGGSYSCTFAMVHPAMELSGTYYIDSKKVRGTVLSTNKAANQSVKSHLLVDGDYSYTWSDAMPYGIKMPVTSNTYSSLGNAAGATGQVSANGATATYNCTAWSADAAIFAVPTSVQFMQSPAAQ